MADIKSLAETLVGLTVKEVQDLATELKDVHGIEPAAAAVVVSSGGGGEAAAKPAPVVQPERGDLQAGVGGSRDEGGQLARVGAVPAHRAGELHHDLPRPAAQCGHVRHVAHREDRTPTRRRGQRGREHHRQQRWRYVVQFVDRADAHEGGSGRPADLVEGGATEAVPVALHHRHQAMSVGLGGALHVRQPLGALDGETDGHIDSTVVRACRCRTGRSAEFRVV